MPLMRALVFILFNTNKKHDGTVITRVTQLRYKYPTRFVHQQNENDTKNSYSVMIQTMTMAPTRLGLLVTNVECPMTNRTSWSAESH